MQKHPWCMSRISLLKREYTLCPEKATLWRRAQVPHVQIWICSRINEQRQHKNSQLSLVLALDFKFRVAFLGVNTGLYYIQLCFQGLFSDSLGSSCIMSCLYNWLEKIRGDNVWSYICIELIIAAWTNAFIPGHNKGNLPVFRLHNRLQWTKIKPGFVQNHNARVVLEQRTIEDLFWSLQIKTRVSMLVLFAYNGM